MNANNDDKKSTSTRKESVVSICDTPTGFISNRKKRKLLVNNLHNINSTLTQIDIPIATRKKQTKSKTKIKENKATSSITKTSDNISMKSTDKTSKKRKLNSSKDDSEFVKQNHIENINFKPNKPVGDHTVISNTDAFDRLKMMSPYPEENVNYTMKLRSRRAKVFNFSSDADEDNDYYLNNSKFASRIRQKSTIKKSSVKKPKTIVKKLRPIRKSLQRKCNNPLIDEIARKSHMEVLDTSITYKDNDELIEADPKSHHLYPEVTIVYPTTDLNKSCTSVTSLNIEVEEPNVNNSFSDNFLTKVKNIFRTNDTNGTDNLQTNIVSSPHEIVDICDMDSIHDEHNEPQIDCSSPKQHNKNESNKQKSVDHCINPTVLTSYDEIVTLEQVQCVELNDCTSSRYLQSMKSKSQMTYKGKTEQKDLSKIHKRHNSVQDKDMAQLRMFNDDFQAKSKVKTHKNRDTKQLSKGIKDTQKIVQISKDVDDPQTSKYDSEVTIVQPIETHISLITSGKSKRSKENPIPESKENSNTDHLNWEVFLDPDIQCINRNGQQPSRSRNTSTPNIYLIESQESQCNNARASEQEQPSSSILNINENISSQSLVVKPGIMLNCHIGQNVEELSAQSSMHNEASQGKMLNTSEHLRTEEQNETTIKLLRDIKKQNEKFLTNVEKDAESMLDLLILDNMRIFNQYIAECEEQKNDTIAKLRTTLRNSLEENNETFNKLEQLFKK